MSATTKTREEFLEETKKQLDSWNQEIDRLEAKGEALNGEALKRYNHQVYELRQQWIAVMGKFDELKVSGMDRWDSVMSELEHVRDTFVHSYNYFKSQL